MILCCKCFNRPCDCDALAKLCRSCYANPCRCPGAGWSVEPGAHLPTGKYVPPVAPFVGVTMQTPPRRAKRPVPYAPGSTRRAPRGATCKTLSTEKNPTTIPDAPGKTVSGQRWDNLLVRLSGERKPVRAFFQWLSSPEVSLDYRPIDLDAPNNDDARPFAEQCSGWWLVWGTTESILILLERYEREMLSTEPRVMLEYAQPLAVSVGTNGQGAAELSEAVKKRLRVFKRPRATSRNLSTTTREAVEDGAERDRMPKDLAEQLERKEREEREKQFPPAVVALTNGKRFRVR